MIPFLIAALPWLLSAITVYMMFLAGDNHRRTWVVGMSNQLLWLFWIVISQTWGLLPMNIALWIVYYRNHREWKREVEHERVLTARNKIAVAANLEPLGEEFEKVWDSNTERLYES